MPLSRRTARQAAPPARPAALRRCLIFAVAGVEYAIDLGHLTRALAVPAGAETAVTVHDATYPLLDLRAVFGRGSEATTRRALLTVRTATQRAALVVDEVRSLSAIQAEEVHPLPAVFSGVEREWFEGLVRVGPRVVVVVRPAGLLSARAAGAAARA